LAVAHDQGHDLGVGIEGLGVHPDEKLADRLAALQVRPSESLWSTWLWPVTTWSPPRSTIPAPVGTSPIT
jgi:hypothetical protein